MANLLKFGFLRRKRVDEEEEDNAKRLRPSSSSQLIEDNASTGNITYTVFFG